MESKTTSSSSASASDSDDGIHMQLLEKALEKTTKKCVSSFKWVGNPLCMCWLVIPTVARVGVPEFWGDGIYFVFVRFVEVIPVCSIPSHDVLDPLCPSSTV